MPAPKLQRQVNPVIETVIQEEALQPPAVETSFELPVVSPPAPQPIGTWSPEKYNYAGYEREVSMGVFDAENQIQKLLKALSLNWKGHQLISVFNS